MDANFVSILERLVNEQGKEAPINAAKAKALLGDYSKNEFKKERHLLLIAIEAGAAQEIANANDLAICKKTTDTIVKSRSFYRRIYGYRNRRSISACSAR
ncbi:MAG: hypothetical protein LBQ52_08350 [Helicobacteraceae bacterium]|jgi:hypothetical protein|nr:hypothetical protein [Helicobacteraceae bacterium]